MFRSHPGQNRAGVAFQNTDAVHPTALKLHEIPTINKPEVVAIPRAIRQGAGLCHRFLLVPGALPWSGSPMHTPIDRHGPPDGGFTGQVWAMLRGQQAVETKAPGARVRLLEV